VIEALSLLPPKAYSLATLTVVGDSFDVNYLREVREQARALAHSEKVLFVGKKNYDQMAEIYRSHDILIAPSLRKEGLPLNMVEAMLSGCAVVTTGSGGAMEIAQLAELLLFPKGDAAALSLVLEGLIADRGALARTARHGQEIALKELTSDRMTDRFIEVFRRLCETAQKRVFQDDRVLKDSHKVEPLAHSRL
jgi:glycosyltransferase involved in cell wall biosynthesis